MAATRHGFGHLVERIGLQRFISFGRRVFTFRKPPVPEHRRGGPERLRLLFEELGPSFIKLGQVLSSRPDMLPIEYARELSRLTDSVAPFPIAEAIEIIETDLGAPVSRLFKDFDSTPIAAASIAQVHAAKLQDGTEVMVKVQRPNIDRVISRDISILRGIAELIEAYVPEMAVYNPGGIVEEFSRTIKREMDFFVEASSAVQMKKNFENSAILYVPRVFTDMSSRRVLVLERIDGIRIDEFERIDKAGFDRKELSRKGAAALFQMILQDGFFHGDPHPGNIFVLPDGRLGLVDFGIMGRVTEENMGYFADTVLALVEHDFDRLVQEYVNMGFVSEETVDIEKFLREIKEEIVEFLEPYYGMAAGQIDLAAYIDRLTQLSIRYRLRMPQNLYLVNKALLTLEGLLRQLDPDFNFIEIARPYVARLMRRRRDPRRIFRTAQRNIEDIYDAVTVLPKQIKSAFRKLLRGDIRVKVEHLDMGRLITDLDRSSNRLAFSIITAAIIVASSIIIHAGLGPRLFGLPVFGLIGYLFAALLGLWILIGILRSGQL